MLQPLQPTTGAEIEETIRRVIVEITDIKPSRIAADTALRDDLGTDSLDLAEIISALGAIFTVDIRDEEVVQLRTLGEMSGYLQAKLAKTVA